MTINTLNGYNNKYMIHEQFIIIFFIKNLYYLQILI